MSKPTWGNHAAVFNACGLVLHEYRYYKPSTRGLDIEGMIEDLEKAQAGSNVLLHACAHNPTGCDPTTEQWHRIAEVCAKNQLFPFFDVAY